MKTRLPPLQRLLVFIEVAKQGSLIGAAHNLCLTNSAVSQHLKALEQQLGQTLFSRSRQGVQLTPVGRQYLTEIEPALQQLTTVTETLFFPKQSNVVTIYLPLTLAMQWLIPHLPAFQAKFPQVDLRIVTNNDVVNEPGHALDLAITYDKPAIPYQHSTLLWRDSLVLLAQPDLLQPKRSPADLMARYTCIYVSAPLRRHDWSDWCRAMQVTEPAERNRLYVTHMVQAIQAVKNKLGILVTHTPLVTDDVASGLVATVPGTEVDNASAYYLIEPVMQPRHQAVQQVKNWLLAQALGGTPR